MRWFSSCARRTARLPIWVIFAAYRNVSAEISSALKRLSGVGIFDHHLKQVLANNNEPARVALYNLQEASFRIIVDRPIIGQISVHVPEIGNASTVTSNHVVRWDVMAARLDPDGHAVDVCLRRL